MLSGRLKIVVGAESIKSEATSFSMLAIPALRDILSEPYVTDFSAHVVEPSRLLRISRRNYCEMLLGQSPGPSAPSRVAELTNSASQAFSPASQARRDSRSVRLAKLTRAQRAGTSSNPELVSAVSSASSTVAPLSLGENALGQDRLPDESGTKEQSDVNQVLPESGSRRP